jgi:putative effector of murein hydrolase LrgA (UPF0299 family)
MNPLLFVAPPVMVATYFGVKKTRARSISLILVASLLTAWHTVYRWVHLDKWIGLSPGS